MSPTSYQLLYPAMLDYKGKNIFLECKTYFKKMFKKMFGSESLCRKSPSEILVTCKISEGDFRLMNALRFLFLYIHKLHHSIDVGLGEGLLFAGGEVLELDGAGLNLVAAID